MYNVYVVYRDLELYFQFCMKDILLKKEEDIFVIVLNIFVS